MDERRKSILSIEDMKAVENVHLETLLTALGRLLLERSEDGRISIERSEWIKLKTELERLHGEIENIARDVARSEALEKEIASIEKENVSAGQDAAAFYPDLGQALLESEHADKFSARYQVKIANCKRKIEEQSKKLEELGAKEKHGAFSWLDSKMKTAFANAALSKEKNVLKRIYTETGAEFVKNPSFHADNNEKIADICAKIKNIIHQSDERTLLLADLREEKRLIATSFSCYGSPARKKTALEQQSLKVNNELNALYMNLGKKASSTLSQLALRSLFDEEMEKLLADALKSIDLISDFDAQIAKLRASLEIDDERAEIEKQEKAIFEQRRRIAASEKAIAECNKRITKSHERIARLIGC